VASAQQLLDDQLHFATLSLRNGEKDGGEDLLGADADSDNEVAGPGSPMSSSTQSIKDALHRQLHALTANRDEGKIAEQQMIVNKLQVRCFCPNFADVLFCFVLL
jgi:hypothetical protein